MSDFEATSGSFWTRNRLGPQEKHPVSPEADGGMAAAKSCSMIENFFVALWVCIFAMLIVTVKRAIRHRSRRCRHAELRALRQFTQENHRPHRKHRRPAFSYQPVAG
jgi:hypothetical protein